MSGNWRAKGLMASVLSSESVNDIRAHPAFHPMSIQE